MRRHFPLYLLAILLAHLSGCGEAPSRPSVITDRPVNPPKTSARYIQVPWDISLFFNIPGGAIVAGATTAATPGAAAEGDNLTGVYTNSNGFGGTLSGVMTGTLESGTFNGSLKTIMSSGCTAERQFSGPVTTQALSWSPGNHLNDCGGTSPLTGQIQVTAAAPGASPCTPYTAVASETSFAAAGGPGTVPVTAGAGCTWFATSSAAFVTVSVAQGTGTGSVQFTVATNGASTARTAIVVVAGQSFTITQAGAPARACNYGLNGTGQTFNASGGLGGVDMRTASGCAWQSQSDAPWLTITGGNSGTGDGTISFAVAANPGLALRVGTVSATGNLVFTLTQTGSCVFVVTPPAPSSFPAEGGSGSATVSTTAGCSWTAVSNAPWITLTGAVSGTGNGTVPFAVGLNTNVARGGTMTIAGQTVNITQAQAAAGTLSGTITNSLNGGPVSGATVTLGHLTATTVTNGTYTLSNVPFGSQTVRVSAPEFVARTDTVVVGVQTTHSVPLTPATPALTFVYNANPVFPDEANRHCGDPEAWCWTYTNILRETGGATLTVTEWEISQYNQQGVPEQRTVYTAADFPRFYSGATGVPANGATTGGAVVWFVSSGGGTIEILISGVDTFNRPFQFVSVPRLSAQERALPLRTVPGGRATTAPPPRPRGGGF